MLIGTCKPALFIGVMIGLVLGIESCSSAEEPWSVSILLSAADAGSKYQNLGSDVSEALNTEYPGLELVSDRDELSMSEASDGVCTLYIDHFKSDADVRTLAGGLEPIMKTVEPVLVEAGFKPITKEDSLKGGWTGVSSSDNHGAEFEMASKGSSRLSVSATVQEENCSLDK